MTNKLLIAAAACGLLAGCASSPPAEEAPVRGRINVFISPMGEPFRGGASDAYPLDRWFTRVDANHDGALQWDEFKADAESFFRQIDTDHDAVLSGAMSLAVSRDTRGRISGATSCS